MKHSLAVLCLLFYITFSGCKSKSSVPPSTVTGTPADTNSQHVSVLTQHNNLTRAGWNNRETRLSIANVNSKQFGKLFTLSVDDQVYAQPLIYGGLTIAGALHNVVYIATVNNTVYAYDGDNGKLFWKNNFTASGMRPPKNTDMTGACGGAYQDFSGNIGIVGTPVIDSAAQTMYFVARNTDGQNFKEYLHAVNVVSGAEQAGSPVEIIASVPGTGDGNVNNIVSFDPQKNNQRAALTLLNGVVYVTFSSHCDWGPYHGWVLGYNSSSLKQQIVYNDTPNGGDGGIWESGTGMCADAQGNLYLVTGNGTVGDGTDPTVLTNRGESALKLSPAGSVLNVASYFTPYTYPNMEANDLDYGSMGALLIPSSNYYITGAKDANIYLLNKDNMGGFSAAANNVQQTITLGSNSSLHCQPAYYKGTNGEFFYVWSENDQLRAFPFSRASNTLSVANQVVSTAGGPNGQSGAVLSVSSNGANDQTGIVWASFAVSGDAEHTVSAGILRAFDAANITKELWNNAQVSTDYAGNFAKFSSPTVANGHVYLPTFSNQVVVYGLK